MPEVVQGQEGACAKCGKEGTTINFMNPSGINFARSRCYPCLDADVKQIRSDICNPVKNEELARVMSVKESEVGHA